MEDILYIVHRIPFPPNKGDKIRSFNILKYLAQHYRVHLATFVDDPIDMSYIPQLDQYVVDKCVIQIDSFHRKVASLAGLLTGEAFSNKFYQNKAIQKWVDHKVTKEGIKKIVLFSSPMAQFVEKHNAPAITRIMDFVDVDSEKWFQYAEKHAFPMSWLYKREGTKLRDFERRVAESFEASLFVSDNEANLFTNKVRPVAGNVVTLFNGVDTEAFNPESSWENPFTLEKKAIVFTGAMDYWANIEAVQWFADHVWPAVFKGNPSAWLYIVGSKPTDNVKALEKLPNVVVTGSVPEVKPYVKHAHVCIAPLRIARGIQNKVLEALAMEKVVVATPEAMEGILGFSEDGELVHECSQAEEFAVRVLSEIECDRPVQIEKARAYVLKHFSWQSHLSKLNDLL